MSRALTSRLLAARERRRREAGLTTGVALDGAGEPNNVERGAVDTAFDANAASFKAPSSANGANRRFRPLDRMTPILGEMPTGPQDGPALLRDEIGEIWLSVVDPKTRSGRRVAWVTPAARLDRLGGPLIAALVEAVKGKAAGTASNMAKGCSSVARLLQRVGLASAGPSDLPADLLLILKTSEEQRLARALTPGQIEALNNARPVLAKVPRWCGSRSGAR